MKLIHKGVRPAYPIEVSDFKRKLFIEELPDGDYKIWNIKLLKSGCGSILDSEFITLLMGCIYCPWCDEYFSKDQWESYEGSV